MSRSTARRKPPRGWLSLSRSVQSLFVVFIVLVLDGETLGVGHALCVDELDFDFAGRVDGKTNPPPAAPKQNTAAPAPAAKGLDLDSLLG